MRKYDLQLSRNMHRPALCSSQSLIFTVFLSQIAPKIAWLCQTGAGAGWFKLTFVLRSRKFSGAGAVSPLLLLLLEAGSYMCTYCMHIDCTSHMYLRSPSMAKIPFSLLPVQKQRKKIVPGQKCESLGNHNWNLKYYFVPQDSHSQAGSTKWALTNSALGDAYF